MNSDYYSCISSDESEGSFYIARKRRRESSGHEFHYERRKSLKHSRSVSSEIRPIRKKVELTKYREVKYEQEKIECLQKSKECINRLLIEINELETLYREISENPESNGFITSVSPKRNENTSYFSCSNIDEIEKDNGHRNERNPKFIVHLDPRKEDVKEVYCKLDEFLEHKYLQKKVKELESALKAAKNSNDNDVHK
ncbi:unnamed protein product [Hymenolepis diminuta]|uniref:Uncharacterized protein n=1 Tax=Hymenolepis diminuta TaxID=6216 RepID=A0A564Y9P4_HYMDI|nr:unnamed protein product [Hymenolepis diminuta]